MVTRITTSVESAIDASVESAIDTYPAKAPRFVCLANRALIRALIHAGILASSGHPQDSRIAWTRTHRANGFRSLDPGDGCSKNP